MSLETSALIASARTAYDIAKGINSLKQEVEKNQAISKILEVLLSVQTEALSMQNMYQELLNSKNALENKLSENKLWSKVESQYHLEELQNGIFVYSQKDKTKSKEPVHWLCANCWQEKKKSIFQIGYHDKYRRIYKCPKCKHEFTIRDSDPPPRERSIRIKDPWVRL